MADGTRLAYRVLGERARPAAVLLDGISCDGFAFIDLEPWLVQRFRVLHPHYRGHGRSGLGPDPGASSLPLFARDLDAVMERARVGPAVLIGHSMGVQVALEMALRYPARVRALVLMCGASGRVLDTFKRTDLGRRLLPYLGHTARTWRDLLARTVRAVLPTGLTYLLAVAAEVKGDRVRQRDLMPYLEHFARMPLDLFAATLTDAAERTSEAWLGRLDVPTLVLAAEDDGFTPVELSRELAARLPQATLEVVADASHLGPRERPAAFEAAIAAFVAAHALDAPAPSRAASPPTLADRWRAAR